MSAHSRHRAHHRKPRARRERQFRNGEVRRERGFGRGGTAAASMRQYLTAGVALVGASAIAVAPVAPAPVAPAPPEIRVASPDVRLAAASLLNIPANLIADLVNIPNSEVRAVDYAARSLFFSGPWWVVGPVNLWGVDPGDPSHFRAVVHFMLPFPALSGLGLPQDSQDGLGQQLWYTAATVLPVDRFCDSDGCMPNVPTSPITGVAGLDALLWYAAIGTAQLQLPIFSTWLTPDRLLDMVFGGYEFDAESPGIISPDGKVYDLLGIPGTVDVDGQQAMPWYGDKFQLDPIRPFFNYFNHLMADPADNPIRLPSLEEIGRAVQALIASMVVAWNPFTQGSPLCPGTCQWVDDLNIDSPDIVKFIGKLWPGNEIIDTWVAAYDRLEANWPSQEIIDRSVDLLQQEFWSFGNPSPPASWSGGFNFSTLAPLFHKMWTDFGFDPPPLNFDEVDPDSPLGPVDDPPVDELQFSEKLSQPTIPPSTTSNVVTVDLNAAPYAPDSQVTKDWSVQPPQDVPPITPAVTQSPAAAVPNATDPKAGPALPRETTRDGNISVPGKVGGNGTRHRGLLRDALTSAGEQINSSISNVTGGLTGGTKTDNTDKTGSTGNTGGTDNTGSTGDSGGKHRAE
jgi:hypothetical protein